MPDRVEAYIRIFTDLGAVCGVLVYVIGAEAWSLW
jgi:hypothetical protein